VEADEGSSLWDRDDILSCVEECGEGLDNRLGYSWYGSNRIGGGEDSGEEPRACVSRGAKVMLLGPRCRLGGDDAKGRGSACADL